MVCSNRIAGQFSTVVAGLALAAGPAAGSAPIELDGLYADWAAIGAKMDDRGDQASGLDLGRIWLANDAEFLFVRIEFGEEFDLSENNDLSLAIDGDNNPATGASFEDIGAELIWNFGTRSGTNPLPVDQADIRFRGMPTITATEFEFGIARSALGGGSTIALVFRDNDGGDTVPNTGATLSYTFDETPVAPLAPTDLDRESPGDVRLLTWNILNDRLFTPIHQSKFERVITAVQPDIIAFQEVYSHSASATAALVEQWLPSGPNEAWYAAKTSDCVTVSRFPIQTQWSSGGNLVTKLDATAALGKTCLIANAHLPCCSNDAGRQFEVDALMAFIRDAKTGLNGGLDPNAPFLLVGDMNFVGLAQQVTTMLTGDIIDEVTFGADFAPDWDGTSLTSVTPRQTDARQGYTWRDDGSDFWPGHLDYIVYSDSVLETGRSFAIDTREMPATRLAAYGLQTDDSSASDHLAFVVDLRQPACLAEDLNHDNAVDSTDLSLLLTNFGQQVRATRFAGDLDGDEDVDSSDLSLLLTQFGASCAP